jgi:3-hydroxyacyl-[acyl-carrier-protein] dehydratase
MAQSSALLAFSENHDDDTIYYFAGIDNARFKKPVLPGDQLILNAEVVRSKGGIWSLMRSATVDNETCCSGRLLCAIRQKGIICP